MSRLQAAAVRTDPLPDAAWRKKFSVKRNREELAGEIPGSAILTLGTFTKDHPMSTFLRIASALVLATTFAAAPALAVETMSKDSMAKDSMSKDSMAKDTMAKDSMSKDAMSKDSMAKDSMAKDSMAKDSMKK